MTGGELGGAGRDLRCAVCRRSLPRGAVLLVLPRMDGRAPFVVCRPGLRYGAEPCHVAAGSVARSAIRLLDVDAARAFDRLEAAAGREQAEGRGEGSSRVRHLARGPRSTDLASGVAPVQAVPPITTADPARGAQGMRS